MARRPLRQLVWSPMATMRDRLADARAKTFVGRIELLNELSEFFQGRDKLIYSVSGVSGIGKSWLIREVGGRARAAGWHTVLADINDVATPMRFLEFAAHELFEQKVALSSYFYGREMLDRLTQRVESHLAPRPSRSTGVVDVGEVERTIRQVLGDKDATIYLDAESFLTTAFVSDLVNLERVGILIDTFEKASGDMERWIREELLRNLTESARVVICGQRSLGADWSEWSSFMLDRELGNFSTREMAELLTAHGEHKDLDVHTLMELTGGYPLAAGLYVATGVSDATMPGADFAAGASVTDAVVSRMLRGIEDIELRRLVYAVAGFPLINRELAALAVDAEVPYSLWQSFSALSFVRRSHGGFELHDVVQRFVSEAATREAPQSAKERHRRAAEYWSDRGDHELCIFHLALADGDLAMREAREFIRSAFNRGDSVPIEALIARVEGAGRIVPRMRAMSFLLQAVRASVRGDWQVVTFESLRVDIAHLDADVLVPSRLLACEALRYQGNLAGAVRMASEGLARGTSTRSPNAPVALDTVCELRMQLVELDGLRGLHARAHESLATLARELRGSTSSLYLQAALCFQREHLARWQGEWKVALQGLRDCLELLKSAINVDPFLIGRLEYGLGRVLTYGGWFTSAWTVLSKAEERFRGIGRQQHLGEALVGKAIVARECGRWDESVQLLHLAKDVFQESHAVLYESWVRANELKLAAFANPSEVDVAAALGFAEECERIEYKHGQGHALFTADAHDRFAQERARVCFDAAGMRYEELEASVYSRLVKGQSAADLAIRALSRGDYWTAARAAGSAREWLAYEKANGPHDNSFASGAIIEVILGQPRSGLRVDLARNIADLLGALKTYGGFDSAGHN
jgi:hypothetical protein